MQTIAIIGSGAIGEAVAGYLAGNEGVAIGVAVIEPGMESRARDVYGRQVEIVTDPDDASTPVDLAVDCAGHPALRQHGEAILSRGINLVSVSSGALADADLYERLAAAATRGGSQLRVVSGAIGALDALSSASVGALQHVTYRGRKPPRGWLGSPAEAKLDLESLTEATVHFSGSARSAALEYPKNANVAASVALAGIGFDDTIVELIADPDATRNVHEIVAQGDFGRLEFRIEGASLPDNPRSSAITAMSVVREILNPSSPIVI
ncbi:MAG: aspartate dehydrogenase [Chromatiales bacterium]|nr:MAG: aspartate dehydrogenase [Chromatiales bacterium]